MSELVCTSCLKPLTGRQKKWCSLSCKRDFETQKIVIDGIATYTRTCRTCAMVKPLHDFYKTPTGTHRRICRSCTVDGNKARDAKPDVADKKRNQHLMGLYGISSEEYEEMFKSQGGVCAVCGKPPIKTRLAVDHDHVTKKIRGLLCSRCNLWVIGKFRDPETLLSAANYLSDPPAEKVLGERLVPANRPRKRRARRKR